MVEAQDWGGLTSAAVAEPTRTGQTCCKPSCHPKAPECPRASSKPPAQQPMASTRQPRVPREGNRPPHYRARDRFRMTAISGDKKKKKSTLQLQGGRKEKPLPLRGWASPCALQGTAAGRQGWSWPCPALRLWHCQRGCTAHLPPKYLSLLNTTSS